MDIETFYTLNGVQRIDLRRTSSRLPGDSYLYLGLKTVTEGVFLPQYVDDTAEFSFYKELDNDRIFSVEVDGHFEDTDAYIKELSQAQNQTYQLATYQDGRIYYFSTTDNSVDVWGFTYNSYEIYYSKATGALVSVYDYNTSTRFTAGAVFTLFNKLRFKYNASAGVAMNVFYDAATNTSLHQAIPAVPADQLLITNYVRNASGVVTFDFTLKVSGYHENSTGHDLTITGKFNSGDAVHKEIGS
jgi:hypothetical protein